jgi:hypothetical protein
MGSLCLWLAVVAACLLWTAALTAAAARIPPTGWRLVLLALALAVPVLLLALLVAPLVLLQRPGWWMYGVSAWLAAIGGGLWILRAGAAERSVADALHGSGGAGEPVAAGWWPVGLLALSLLAASVALGTVAIIDNAASADLAQRQLEAQSRLRIRLPVPIPAAADALPLYLEAAGLLEDDPALTADDSPLHNLSPDASAPARAELLGRHADALAALRKAADAEACGASEQWRAGDMDTFLERTTVLRLCARFLALAARHEAATGDMQGAVADIVRLRRIARHATDKPVLLTGAVGLAIDSLALDTLADVLPLTRPADRPLLAGPLAHQLTTPGTSPTTILMGEETFGLAQFAEMAAAGPAVAADLDEAAAPLYAQWVAGPLFRLSVLPDELAAYSSCLERYQQAAATESLAARQLLAREAETSAADGGTLAQLVAPGLSRFLESQNRFDAKRAAATVLLAATRQRLETGTLPDALEKLVPTELEAVPADSFLGEPATQPLRLLQTTGEWTIYSIGPNGNDDGGPLPKGAEPATGNDDIGLSMKR